MVLTAGKAGKVRFIRGIKKTNIFECNGNGIVVEREGHDIRLYVTNAACSQIFCTVPLGGKQVNKANKFLCAAYTDQQMILEGQTVQVVVDFAQKKLAVSNPDVQANCKEGWEQMPWSKRFNAMFGLSSEELEMDDEAAGEFWAWFEENETQIVDAYLEGGKAAQEMNKQIRYYLAPVFPYEKPAAIEFDVVITDEWNKLYMYHYNSEKLKADAEKLVQWMPEEMKKTWRYLTRA